MNSRGAENQGGEENRGIQYVTLVNVLMNSAMYAVMMLSYSHQLCGTSVIIVRTSSQKLWQKVRYYCNSFL